MPTGDRLCSAPPRLLQLLGSETVEEARESSGQHSAVALRRGLVSPRVGLPNRRPFQLFARQRDGLTSLVVNPGRSRTPLRPR
jgi:hypothetical protein